MESFFEKSRLFVLSALLFLFPLFFIPVTTEFYSTNKLYLLTAGSVVLVVISSFRLLSGKKIDAGIKIFDIPVLLVLISCAASILLVSPNKVSALLNPAGGILSLAALTLIYFYLSREKSDDHLIGYVTVLQFSAIILALIEIILFIFSVTSVKFDGVLSILNSPLFTPAGNLMDLMAFLGFFLVYSGINFVSGIVNKDPNYKDVMIFIVIAAGLTVSANTFIHTARTDLPYAPLSYSMSAIQVLFGSPLNTMFGYGVDNFSALFTQVKDPSYASSPFGSLATFNLSRNLFTQVIAETGLLGFLTILLVFFRGILESSSLPKEVKIPTLGLFAYLAVACFIFPPSITLWFILFVTLGLLHHDITAHSSKNHRRNVRTAKPPLALNLFLVILLFGALSYGSYILITYYQADVSFRDSLESVSSRNIASVYANQLNAVSLNPYIEKYRIGFSQTNMYIANQFAANAKASNTKLSDRDKQTVMNAISTSIKEAKAAIVLNPQKASNWENLGNVYKNLVNVVDKADKYSIGAYERAINLDKANPVYQNELGEIYYLTGQFKTSSGYFKEAIKLNPSYGNAYYNLAWSYYKLGAREQAAAAMKNVISLARENHQDALYQRAVSDLKTFGEQPQNGR